MVRPKPFNTCMVVFPNDVANKIEFLDLTKKFFKGWEEYQDNSFVQTRRYFRNLIKKSTNMNPKNYLITTFRHETESNVDSLHGFSLLFIK
ncbi:MAG: hypothetical protein CM15mL4_3110 [uncultured marine virus]|nr:MAG: hypothetical protein CM15mL4_3110 [uncultured marine virus]